jgi:hypothetical protein
MAGDLRDGRLASLKFQAEEAVKQGDALRGQVRARLRQPAGPFV